MGSDPDGTRTIAENADKTAVSKEDGSQSGSFFDCDADLAKIIAAWASLPDAIRRAMLALIG